MANLHIRLSTPRFFIVLSFTLIICRSSFATITIDSVQTTNSSCTNNGSATIFATSNPASTLFYAIVTGPSLSALQNSNLFPSLFPGNYTVRVYDVNFDSTETQFQVAGNYQLPAFDLIVTNPTCQSSSDGTIIVFVDTTFGLPPYLYSMLSPSVIPPQTQNVFTTLPANTYLIRVTDACGNYQTRTAVLSANGTGLSTNASYLIPSLVKTGCDTMVLTQYFYLYKEKSNLPLTLTLNTLSGTISKTVIPEVIDTINLVPGYFRIIDTIPDITYGDYLQLILTDVCNESAYSMLNQVAPYDFELLFNPHLNNCTTTFTASVQLKQYFNYPYDFTTPVDPVSFTLIDITTGTMVDSMMMVPFNTIGLKEETAGNIYSLTITDGCGQVWQQNIQWPAAGNAFVNVYNNIGCLDSTAILGFECKNFKSAYTITILSGPPVAQSSKPHFAFSENIFYPIVFTGIYSPYFNIKDCPPGTYTFEVSDSCGNTIPGSFIIEPYMVSNLGYTWFIRPSCLNNNTLFYNFQEGTPMAVYASITDVANGTLVLEPPLNYGLDSISALPIGQYALEIYYANHNGNGSFYDGSLISSTNSCWVLHDTITISPYTNNSFITNNTIYCNGTNYVELIVDSTRGVPPYKFEILSGPQTFPQQDSGIFQIIIFGNYLISIEDACGNNYTQQITLSSDSFPQIIKDGFTCAGNDLVLSALSSSHFSYIWQYPDGSITTGDSISFHPFTISDTGMYHITKMVEINGCKDTLYSEYFLSINDSIPISFSICEGDSVMVGPHVYTFPGVYYDSLSTTFGCDSIVVTTITYKSPDIDSNRVSICYGDTLTVGSSAYFQTGTYADTVTMQGGCKKIIVTELDANQITDSITAMICEGDSFLFGNAAYYQPGIYADTLVSVSGCDSVIIAQLTFIPLMVDSNSAIICFGDSLIVGTSIYFLPGTYMDTVTSPVGCKKVIITALEVNHIIDSINIVICQGDSFLMGSVVYYQSGTYQDTLISSSGCDSVIVLDLYTNLPATSSTTAVICQGDSVAFANNYYSQPGVYIHTFSIAGCDSIATLILTVTTTSALTIQVSNDTIQAGNTILLTCANQLAIGYSWSGNAVFSNSNAIQTNATLTSSAWLYLSATGSNGCQGIDSVFIFIDENDGDSCEGSLLFIPNTFTPNRDGINDLFKVVATHIQLHNVVIFNRWGEQVFESNNAEHSWDGSFKNSSCAGGVYYYLVQYESCIDHSKKIKHGSITLIN